MKKVIAVALLLTSVAAYAACPPSMPYGCTVWGGKTLCGCGR